MIQFKHYTTAIFILFLLALSHANHAQQADLTSDEVEEYKEQAVQMVSFLQYMLNTLGKPDATTQQKQTIINDSYTKAFVDADVQIEDDLDEDRAVTTNKNVQAYLKDIDFFFENVVFELNVTDVSNYVTNDGDIYFRATINRNLRGTSVAGDTVNANQPRFVEMNLDRGAKQLKIASIYTTKLSEREELANWWNEMPYDWQELLKKEVEVLIDTVNFRMLKEMITLDSLDITENRYITSLQPLSRMYGLTYLNLSGTAISDITPLRNLTKLHTLNISDTQVSDIEPLRYSTDLSVLVADNTSVSELGILTNFNKLKELSVNGTTIYQLPKFSQLIELQCANTAITNLEAISSIQTLEVLNCASTNVKDLSPLSALENLEHLNLEFTPVADLSALTNLDNLVSLRLNNTPVRSLQPLGKLPNLKKVYCDETPVDRNDAISFMAENPGILIIFESKELISWWDGLDNYWKEIFSSYITSDSPDEETLAAITNITELDISNRPALTSLEPLTQLHSLTKLNCANTSINTLSPLTDLFGLQQLDATATLINSLSGLESARNLQELKFDRTNVNSLAAIIDLNKISFMSCEHTPLEESVVLSFIDKHPDCLVIFKSDDLSLWWNQALSPAWKEALRKQIALDEIPTKKQLHEIVFAESLTINDNSKIWDLTPVNEFVRLQELSLINTGVQDLTPLSKMKMLRKLVVEKNPVKDLEPLSELTSLRYLDFQDTRIEDLKPIRNLIELEVLNCSSTPVSKLKHISSLINLKVLDCSATSVKKLKHIKGLYDLEELIVYNTRVSEKEVNAFKRANPGTTVSYY